MEEHPWIKLRDSYNRNTRVKINERISQVQKEIDKRRADNEDRSDLEKTITSLYREKDNSIPRLPGADKSVICRSCGIKSMKDHKDGVYSCMMPDCNYIYH